MARTPGRWARTTTARRCCSSTPPTRRPLGGRAARRHTPIAPKTTLPRAAEVRRLCSDLGGTDDRRGPSAALERLLDQAVAAGFPSDDPLVAVRSSSTHEA